MTERESDLLVTLTQRVRCLTGHQLTAGWWSTTLSGKAAARHTAALLIRHGLLLKERFLMDPVLPLDSPIVTWQPYQKAPDAVRTSALLHARWTQDPVPMTVYYASWTAARLFGGYGGGITSVTHVTHDVHVAQLYLMFRARPDRHDSRWVSEDVRTIVRGAKVPDAYILNPAGHVERVIEFGGKYTPKRVAEFHAYCQKNELPYQLW